MDLTFPEAKDFRDCWLNAAENNFASNVMRDMFNAAYHGSLSTNVYIGYLTLKPFEKITNDELVDRVSEWVGTKRIRELIDELNSKGYKAEVRKSTYGEVTRFDNMLYKVTLYVSWEE